MYNYISMLVTQRVIRARLKHRACLCDSEEWQSGELTGTVLATLEDYLEEYEHYVLPAFFKRYGNCMQHDRSLMAQSSPSHCHRSVLIATELDFIASVDESAPSVYRETSALVQRVIVCHPVRAAALCMTARA